MSSTPSWQIFKFGGSSLGTPGRLPRVLELIGRAPQPLAVVVSALGDTTDWLLAATRAAALGEVEVVNAELERIRALALSTAAQALSGSELAAFEAELGGIFNVLQDLLAGIRPTGECTPAARDAALSTGERISSSLVTRALSASGTPAVAVDARTFLVTDGNHGSAEVDLEPSRMKLEAAVSGWQGRVPVVTGFIGRSHAGRTTTLGRNGSDYTATLLALFLRAKEVTIWTDVPGVMTADPALVAEAYPVERLTYAEALELAHFGARMFHARTMIPLLESGATLRIRSTADPAAPGTRIDAAGNPDPQRPTCVTSLERLALLSVESRRAGGPGPIGARALDALAAAGIPVWMASQASLGQSLALVAAEADAERARAALELALRPELERGEVQLLPVRAPVTLVTLVAEAMGRRPNVAGRFFHALGNVGVNVRAIAQGATERSISCAVDAEDTATAVRTVHAAFNFAEAEVNVLLLGKGTVGGKLLAQIASQAEPLRKRHGIRLRLVGLADQRRAIFDPVGLDPGSALNRIASEGTERSAANLLDALARLPVPVVADCTAADGMEALYAQAFARGIHVVAANKKPLALALPARDALLEQARQQHRAYLYETTVGASLPVIETLQNLVRTGDEVERIEGSLSGTLNYLSEAIMAGVPLSQAVRTARDRGYTEPHPRDDLSGLDVARKALILARELGHRLELMDIAVEPFAPRAALAEDDPERFLENLVCWDAELATRAARLRSEGRVLRYLARITREGVRVGLVEVERDHPAAGLRGAEAMVAFMTQRYREYPLVVRGAGAGGEVTAAGVLADVLRIAQSVRGRR